MFDHLDWWQVLALLGPIVLIMLVVRRMEKRRGATLYPTLNPYQKTWVLLQMLPPSLSARYLLGLDVHELETYFKSGLEIKGNGSLLHEPVMKEYIKNLESPRKDSEGTLQERLGNATLAAPQEALAHLSRLWPRPELPSESPAKPPAEQTAT